MSEEELPDPFAEGGEDAHQLANQHSGSAIPQPNMGAASENLSLSGQTPAGGGQVQANLHPGSALYRCLVQLLGVAAGALWVWSAGTATDEPLIIFAPTAPMLAGSAYLAYRGSRRQWRQLHQTDDDEQSPGTGRRT